jgi:membrane protein DedA with SNARE-associated domain
MKPGIWIALLGILGVVAGAAMYLSDFHRTIGLGGVGLGVVLLVVGGYLSMQKQKAAAAPNPM